MSPEWITISQIALGIVLACCLLRPSIERWLDERRRRRDGRALERMRQRERQARARRDAGAGAYTSGACRQPRRVAPDFVWHMGAWWRFRNLPWSMQKAFRRAGRF